MPAKTSWSPSRSARNCTNTHTTSGIDIALWDILGKVTGQPVGRLLGTCYRERVRPYASSLMDWPERLAEQLLVFKAQGFRGFKIGWGPIVRQSSSVDEAIVIAKDLEFGSAAST
jgi:D-galactarolactone cycloisomerase